MTTLRTSSSSVNRDDDVEASYPTHTSEVEGSLLAEGRFTMQEISVYFGMCVA